MSNQLIVSRPTYIEKLKNWMNQLDLVKIVTGVRRCGKSMLCELFQKELLKEGITDREHIISINLEDPKNVSKIQLKRTKNNFLTGHEILLDYILGQLKDKKTYYVFLDEIQLLEDWYILANGLRLHGNIDLYLTGSNAYMFSSDLANTFGGRYIEIKVHPLSFSEYFNFFVTKSDLSSTASFIDLNKVYSSYLHESGFPQIQRLTGIQNKQVVTDYLMDTVFQNTIQKDIVKRFGITNDIKLDNVIKYMFDNCGKETSLRGIERGLKSCGYNLSVPTIDVYIKGLLDSFLMYRCDRYDIKGKQVLQGVAKYYVVDQGLRYAILDDKDTDQGFILENVVYMELIRRGYRVYVGKIQSQVKNKKGVSERKITEVDFVAKKSGGQTEYYQVALSIMKSEDTIAREYASLSQIKDNYPKYILTLDPGSGENNGIKRINALDWMLASS